MTRAVSLGIDPQGKPVAVTPGERSTHMHVVGASGRGKSKFLEQLIRQDIRHRHGLCLIDPHGTLYQDVVAWCARNGLQRRRRIHLVDPNDPAWTVGFDPLRCDDPEDLSLAVDATVEACAQVWGGEDSNRTPLLKKCLRAVFYALAANGHPFSDALALTKINDVDGFRASATGNLPDSIYQTVWDDLNGLSKREFAETFSSTHNRLLEFLSSPLIRRMLSLKEDVLDLRRCMAEGDIVLVNLQPKKISNDNARLVGTLLTNSLFNIAIRRDEREAKRQPFYLYVDECYQYLTSDVEAMLDQTRKFGLHLILSHQHLAQLSKYGEHVYQAVMTNAQTKVVFGGLSDGDGETLARELLRETFDFNRTKEALDKPVVVGFERVIMNSQGRAVGKALTEGESSMSANMSGMAMGSGAVQTFDADGLPIGVSASEVSTANSGFSQGVGSMKAVSESEVRSEGQSEALMPVLAMMPTSVESQDEILHRATLAIRKLPPRGFFLTRPHQPPTLMVTPEVKEPRVSARRITAFLTAARETSPFLMRRDAVEALMETRDEEETFVDDDDDDVFSVPDQ